MRNVDDLIKAMHEKEERKVFTDEELNKLKAACRSVFAGENGKIIARAMMRASGIYKLNKNISNQSVMAAERGKEYMYLLFVKAMLTPEQLSAIERGTDD